MAQNDEKFISRLQKEFDNLKQKLFGKDIFVQLDESKSETQRYNQLFQFFHPSFRTKDFVSPVPTSYMATAIAEGFCEGEGATEQQQIEAWQYLHDTGLAYKLQGWFGRTAVALIEEGIIEK